MFPACYTARLQAVFSPLARDTALSCTAVLPGESEIISPRGPIVHRPVSHAPCARNFRIAKGKPFRILAQRIESSRVEKAEGSVLNVLRLQRNVRNKAKCLPW